MCRCLPKGAHASRKKKRDTYRWSKKKRLNRFLRSMKSLPRKHPPFNRTCLRSNLSSNRARYLRSKKMMLIISWPSQFLIRLTLLNWGNLMLEIIKRILPRFSTHIWPLRRFKLRFVKLIEVRFMKMRMNCSSLIRPLDTIKEKFKNWTST